MAKKTPQQLKAEGEELKAVLHKAKTKTLNCALLISEDGVHFETHHILAPDKLWLAARKQKGTTNRGVKGTLDVSGVSVKITCDAEPPGNFELKLKQHFAQLGIKMKPEIILPGAGAPPAAQAADSPATPEAQAGAARRQDEEQSEAETAPGGGSPEAVTGGATPEGQSNAAAASDTGDAPEDDVAAQQALLREALARF